MPIWGSPIGTQLGAPAPGKVLVCMDNKGAGIWSGGSASGGIGGDAVSTYKPVQAASAVFVGGESGAHGIGQGSKSKHQTATTTPIVIAMGPTAALPTVVTGSVFVNSVAPGRSFTFGITAVSIHAGTSGSGSFGYSFGSSSYSHTVSSPSASSASYFIGAEDPDGQPSGGPWAFTVTPSGVIAAGSVVHVTMAMWLKV
jgi:hypothetical protein